MRKNGAGKLVVATPWGMLIALAATATAAHAAVNDLRFTEVSGSAGIQVTFAQAPTCPSGLAHMLAGGACGDFDGDGWQDLFVLGGGAEPDRLYLNGRDGTFVDNAAAWGVAEHHHGSGVAVGDFDADGRLDLFVTSFGPASSFLTNGAHRLYRNTGSGFEDVADTAGVATSDTVPNGFGASFGDYDLDGDLDLFVAGWFTNGDGGNRLFRNEGNGTFSDVTVEAGILDVEVHGFAPRFVDTDGDRYPEILLAADFETSRYWRNDGDGTFTDITAASGTGLDCNGMGATIGDFDNDGRVDWYVTNIYVENSGCGNRLYMNETSHQFAEVSGVAGIEDGAWGWGTVAVDFDHDGWMDLAEVNGFQDDSFNEIWSNQPARLWLNAGDGSFGEQAARCELTHTGQGRGLLNFDYDNDGDQDLVIFSAPAPTEATVPLQLHRNDYDGGGHWLRLLFDTSANPRLAPNGFGTRVSASAGASAQHRYLDGGSNYLSQSELAVHFGLGSAASVDELLVEWADGQVTVMQDVDADQTMTIVAPPRRGDADADGMVGFTDLTFVLNQWGPCGEPGTCPDWDGDGIVGFAELTLVLSSWG